MGPSSEASYTVEQVEVALALTLRGALLAPGRPGSDAVDPADHDHGTVHLGAYRNDTLVGVATVTRENIPGTATPTAYRVYGVAVEHGHRGRGVGGLLVDAGRAAARAEGATVLWATVPAAAHGFFEHIGFHRIDDPFSDPAGVPHYRMVEELADRR